MMEAAQLTALLEANLSAYFANYGTLPGAEWHATPACDWLLTGIAEPHFNGIMRANLPVTGLDAAIAELLAPFAQRILPAVWHIGPASAPPHLGAALEAHGLEHIEDEPGMVLDLATWQDATPLPTGLAINQIQDDAGMRDWIKVWLFPSEIPEEVHDRCFATQAGLGYAPTRPLRHLIGWLDGRPVAIAAMFLQSEVAAVHHVVTHAEVRRRGIGAAMTAAIIRMAQRGGTLCCADSLARRFPILPTPGLHHRLLTEFVSFSANTLKVARNIPCGDIMAAWIVY